MQSHWYVLGSKPGKEFFLEQHLREQALPVFLPTFEYRIPSRRGTRTKPYFPGYLFVQADLDVVGESFFRWMPNALGLVTFGEVPARVPDPVLAELREHLSAPQGGTRKRSRQQFRSGESVRIDGGPFTGYSAIFDSHLSGSDRARVLLDLLSRQQISVTLHTSQLRKGN